MPPLKGSHVKDDDNTCLQCHTTPDAWDPKDKERYRFYLGMDALKKDVHYQKGVNCVDCHGGDATVFDPKAHQAKEDFRWKLPEIQKFCAHCHDKPVALLRAGPHKSVGCLDCHATADAQGTILPHTISASMQEKLSDQVGFCGKCHSAEGVKAGRVPWTRLRISARACTPRPAAKTRRGKAPCLSCDKCHGPFTHSLLPVKDPKSPVRSVGQVQKCGGCHQEIEKDQDKVESFLRSVHGQGMEKMGLSVGPGCADCHGSHNVFRPGDERSTLYVTHVADTCGKCHQGIEDRLRASVHGRGGLGGQADRPAPGGKNRQKPTCTSCHQGHELPSPESVAFREAVAGQLRQLPRRHVQSLRLEHARQVDRPGLRAGRQVRRLPRFPRHPGSGRSQFHAFAGEPGADLRPSATPMPAANFVDFNPHLDPYDAQKNPVVHAVQITLLTLLYSTFAFFGVHSLLVVHSRTGRSAQARPASWFAAGRDGLRAVRVLPSHRPHDHDVVVPGAGLDGPAAEVPRSPWAKSLARAMGGFQSTSFWHRFFGVILLVSMLVYMARMVRLLVQGRKQGRSLASLIFGSDSPRAEAPRPQGLPEDAALVLRPGAQAGLRSLVVLGEDRLLGRRSPTR